MNTVQLDGAQPSRGTSVNLRSWNEELAVLKEAPYGFFDD